MITIEDGTVVTGADSYVSVGDADSYIQKYFPQDIIWKNLTTTEKESFLVRGQRFLDLMVKWRSEIKSKEQSLLWPRLEFQDNSGRVVKQDSIPTAIKDAQIELSYSLAQGEELTTEYDKLEREDFGDTTDVYSSPVIRGGNTLVRSLIKSLSYSGYGHNRASIVTIWRA